MFTEPKSDVLFIRRLLESLSDSYQTIGFKEKEEKVKELIRLFWAKPSVKKKNSELL